MLPTIKEFWKKAFKLDKNGDYAYPHYAHAARDLDSRLNTGAGSKGGGYVLICPNCGHAMYTHDKRRKFCSLKCKNDAYRKAYNMMHPQASGIAERIGLTRVCQFCGEEFKVSKSVVKKGSGVYCCRECASKSRGLVPITYICNHCGGTFKSVFLHHAAFCSVNCMKMSPNFDTKNNIIVYRPRLFNESDSVEEEINNMVYEIVSERYRRLTKEERESTEKEPYTVELREKATSRLFGKRKNKQIHPRK